MHEFQDPLRQLFLSQVCRCSLRKIFFCKIRMMVKRSCYCRANTPFKKATEKWDEPHHDLKTKGPVPQPIARSDSCSVNTTLSAVTDFASMELTKLIRAKLQSPFKIIGGSHLDELIQDLTTISKACKWVR